MGLREAKHRLAAIQSERPTTSEFLTALADEPGTTVHDLAQFATEMGVANTVTLKQLWDLAPVNGLDPVVDVQPVRRGRKPGVTRNGSPVGVIVKKRKWKCNTHKGRAEFQDAVQQVMAADGTWMATRTVADALGTSVGRVRDALYHFMRSKQLGGNGKAKGWTRYKWGEPPTARDKLAAAAQSSRNSPEYKTSPKFRAAHAKKFAAITRIGTSGNGPGTAAKRKTAAKAKKARDRAAKARAAKAVKKAAASDA